MEVCPLVRLAVRWPSARRTAVFPGRPSANPTARRTEAAVPTGVRPSVRPCDRPAGCPAVRLGHLLRPSPWQSAGPTARRTASSVPQPSARLSTARMASCLIPAPGSPPPLPRRSPPPTVLSMVEFQVSIRRAEQTPSVCFRTYISQEL